MTQKLNYAVMTNGETGVRGNMIYTIESAAAALAAGETTVQSIAAETGWPLIDDILIPEPNMWHANDGNAEIIEEHDSAHEAAQSYVDDGTWGDTSETQWISVRVWREGIDEDGDIVCVDEESSKVTIEAEEPECTGGEEHDWRSPYSIVGGIEENPGVWGHGGGIMIQEVCMICGCGKTTDTWAQDPSDGQQGLDSVSYEPGKYTGEIERRKAKKVREFVSSHEDDDDFDDEELERMFLLAYDREPDDSDRETGLWSLICAAICEK
jgi:hypothetical protein